MKYTGTVIEYVAGYMGLDLKMKLVVSPQNRYDGDYEKGCDRYRVKLKKLKKREPKPELGGIPKLNG